MPFDIASLRKFAPPQYQCEKCLALLVGDLFLRYAQEDGKSLTCPICHVIYQPTKKVFAHDWKAHFDRRGPTWLNAKDALAQAHQLAEIAERMGFHQQHTYPWDAYTPLHGLLKTLSIAQKFVPFTTYGGIPHLLIGALKVTAQRVHMRGIVSGTKGEMLSENTVSELTNYCDEAPKMRVKIYDPSLIGFTSMPHQKLIIVDGLLAFKGSANLTLAGWRKAAQGRDTVEVVTEVDQVIELNNRLFAPIWAELSEIGETIDMTW